MTSPRIAEHPARESSCIGSTNSSKGNWRVSFCVTMNRSERIRTRLLDQVEGPRVGSGDLAGFRQNHSEQDADIASFRQRHADAVQLLHIALGSLEFRARGAFALGHLDVFKRRVDGLAHQFRSCLIGKSGEATGGVLAISAVS